MNSTGIRGAAPGGQGAEVKQVLMRGSLRLALAVLLSGGLTAGAAAQQEAGPPEVGTEPPAPTAIPAQSVAPGPPAVAAEQAPALPDAAAAAATPGPAAAPVTSDPLAAPAPVASDPAMAPAAGGNPPAVDDRAEATLPRDLSPWGMFQAADIVVKAVMVGLAFASLATWTVWIADKSLELAVARARLRRGLAAILAAPDLAAAGRTLSGRAGPTAAMVAAAEAEAARSLGALDEAGGRAFSPASARTSGASRRKRGGAVGTGVLATIGATAPFVGLFGTVWGIMNSFIGISESQTTNLAVVAPGIAEALLATALGLVAAIPAVVIYNVFARSTAGYRALLADAAAGVERLVSRDLDHRRLEAVARSAAA